MDDEDDEDDDELNGGVFGLMHICSYLSFLCSSIDVDSFDLERERDLRP